MRTAYLTLAALVCVAVEARIQLNVNVKAAQDHVAKALSERATRDLVAANAQENGAKEQDRRQLINSRLGNDDSVVEDAFWNPLCPRDIKQYKAEIAYYTQTLVHWQDQENKLGEKFNLAASAVQTCEDNINARFDYFGCNEGLSSYPQNIVFVDAQAHQPNIYIWPKFVEIAQKEDLATTMRRRLRKAESKQNVLDEENVGDAEGRPRRGRARSHRLNPPPPPTVSKPPTFDRTKYDEWGNPYYWAPTISPQEREELQERKRDRMKAELEAIERNCIPGTACNGKTCNFKNIEEWLIRINHENEGIQQKTNNAEASRQTALNKLNAKEKSCEFSFSSLDDIAAGIVAVAEAIASVIGDLIDALGCMIIDVALSVVGAVLDGILKALVPGVAALSTTFIGLLICGPKGIQRSGAKDLSDDLKTMARKENIKALKDNTKENLKGKSLEIALTTAPKAAFAFEGSAGLLQSNATGNLRSAVGFGRQDAFDFLFMFIMATLSEIAKHECCTQLQSLVDQSTNIGIIQWIMMRAVDAFCGNFATFLMECVKQITFCNACEFCPKGSCTLTFLVFRETCQTKWGMSDNDVSFKGGKGLLETNGTNTHAHMVRARALETTLMQHEVLNSEDPEAIYNAPSPKLTLLTGNDGTQGCNAFCKDNGEAQGASGHKEVDITVGDSKKTLQLYAESPLHSTDAGSSPCCPASNRWGKTTTCTTCACLDER